MLVAAMLVLGICLGALIAVAAYATELKRIARFLRTRDAHSNARVTSGTPAPGLRELAEAVNAGLDQASRERIAALRSQEEFQRDLSALSHDIRTPLTGAKGYLQLARDERDATVRDRHLEAAAARIDSTSELLDELFAYTKSTDPDLAPAPERVDARSAIEQALLAHYPELEAKGWEPEVACPDAVTVLANGDALARVFDNLVTNAVRHGTGAPRIRVHAEGETACIVFENPVDPGAHIDVDRLFDRFYQADSARGAAGSGLGLAIAANLVRAMHGEIRAHLDPGALAIELTFPTA
ncbi:MULTISPECIES: sensor histidine kinase [Enorma]|uniref:sensor histidine kinase n=1 Tax=Enorma TaxID=1472762 RepID=UPI000346049A|nr:MULTISPECIES: HAMP domain-containing sensor histidine kinase [Enorma]